MLKNPSNLVSDQLEARLRCRSKRYAWVAPRPPGACATTTMLNNPLPAQLAAQAETIVNTLQQTQYQYTEQIDPDTGVYDCDCSAFVGYLLQTLAPGHYSLIPKELAQPRPRAFEYHDFFTTLTPTSPGGWHRILFLPDAQRGDILSWRFPDIEKGHDTGHVVILGDTPHEVQPGVFAVRVYDAANAAHFEDTRGSGPGQFPTGVGTGFLNFQVDAEGKPTAFQFAPADSFDVESIVIGRPEPL